jgi:hypothetical protein
MGGEFSDNRDGTATNKQNNLDGIVEPRAEFIWQDADRTRMQLMVMPQMRWHSHPRTAAEGSAQDSTELFGACGLEVMYRPTPTVTLNGGDQLSYSDDSTKIENGITSRRSESYVRNDAHAGVNAAASAAGGANLSASMETMRYTDAATARDLDSDLFVGELAPYYDLGAGWKLHGVVGASEYQAAETTRMRGSAVETFHAGVENFITQDFVWKVMGGYQFMQYDNPALDPASTPSGSAEVKFMATAPTRFRLGVEYGYTPPSSSEYSAQQAATFSGAVDHDVLAGRLTFSLQGQYRDSLYTNEGIDAPGGSEKMERIGFHGTYLLGNQCSLTGGYSYENWESDLRESFQRNMLDINVRVIW